MKKAIFIVIGSLAVSAAYQIGIRENDTAGVPSSPIVQAGESMPIQEAPSTPQVPIIRPNNKPETPNDPISVSEPVLPVEERGDSMLSEIDMLGGMPFDQSITMPFD